MQRESPFQRPLHRHRQFSSHRDGPCNTNHETRRRTRVPLSCHECTRRKIKCDKQVPCQPCIERGEAERCHRHIGSARRSTAPPAPPASDAQSNPQPSSNAATTSPLSDVQRRLARIESMLRITDDRFSSPGASDQLGSFQTVESRPPQRNLASTMEDAALNIGEIHRWQRAPRLADPKVSGRDHVWSAPKSFSDCLLALPSKAESFAIIDAFCAHLNWMCGCTHTPTLKRLHQQFWASEEHALPEESMFLSLLFAIYSNAAYLLTHSQAASVGLGLSWLQPSASLWFDCSFSTFLRCGGFSNESLMACQAMATLNYAFHLSGNSRIHAVMPHINIGMARAINLHLLGSRTEESSDEMIEQELGRRVWWQLVEVEWYFLPFQRYTCVAPYHFDTALPSLLEDEKISTSSSSPHSSLTYLLACCQSSRILYDLYGQLLPNQSPLYDAVLRASGSLEAIQRRFCCRDEERRNENGFELLHMSRILRMTLANRSYLIHRSYFFKSLTDDRYASSYSTCVEAAESILVANEEGLPPGFLRLWNVTLWLVAAGMVLALSLAKATDREERLQRLKALVNMLNTDADQSGIAARGATIITHLCTLDPQSTESSANIDRADILRLISSCEDRSIAREPDKSEQVASLELDTEYEASLDHRSGDRDAIIEQYPDTQFPSEMQWSISDSDFTTMSFGMFMGREQDQLVDLFDNMIPRS